MGLPGRCYYGLGRTRLGHGLLSVAVRMARRCGVLRRFRLPLDALALDHPSAAGLMRLWSRIHWAGADGMMPPDQLLAIYRFAARWPVDGDVVELGAWTGLTTCYLATACCVRGSGHAYAVDTFGGTREGGGRYDAVDRYGGSTWHAFRQRIQRARLSGWVTALVGDTVAMASRYPGRAIRLLLIDADHSYAGVRRDYHAWLPCVAPGGLIVFHDYDMPEGGVAEFVRREVLNDPRCDSAPGKIAPNVMAVARRIDVASGFAEPPVAGPVAGLNEPGLRAEADRPMDARATVEASPGTPLASVLQELASAREREADAVGARVTAEFGAGPNPITGRQTCDSATRSGAPEPDRGRGP